VLGNDILSEVSLHYLLKPFFKFAKSPTGSDGLHMQRLSYLYTEKLRAPCMLKASRPYCICTTILRVPIYIFLKKLLHIGSLKLTTVLKVNR